MAVIAIRRTTHPVPAGARAGERPLYAIGDVHGCYDLLHALLGEIGRDAVERHPGVVPMLVMCGDYVDRGPASAQVLAALVWLMRSKAVDVRLLEGNHEAMLLAFLDQPTQHEPWLRFGGAATLRSYGLHVPDDRDEQMLVGLRDDLLDVMPVAHHDLLNRLELIVEAGDYAFVHAGVVPGVPLRAQVREDLLWIREEFLDHPRPATSVIVHGHSWHDENPVVLPHRLGIDTGAYETGVLTAVRIGNEAIEIIQAVRGPMSTE